MLSNALMTKDQNLTLWRTHNDGSSISYNLGGIRTRIAKTKKGSNDRNVYQYGIDVVDALASCDNPPSFKFLTGEHD